MVALTTLLTKSPGSHGDSGLPRSGQCLDGDRLYARHRHSPAAHELWRLGNGFCFFGFGPGDERPYAAVRQLTRLIFQ